MADVKSQQYVTIGCRLPNGYVLEVGLQTTQLVQTPAGGKALIANVQQLENYQFFTLKGVNERIRRGMREEKILLPARLKPDPFYNRNVPKDLWEQWKREHPKNGALKRGDIFEVQPGEANERAATLDAHAKPGPLEPLEQGKFTVGDLTIEKADFDKN